MAAWTKKEVQRHARVAAAVELYTVPFYTTVMTSVIDDTSEAYNIIRGVLIEEMMHLQLAANLCLALDTPPGFQLPNYDIPVYFLNPGATLDADMGPLDDKSLGAMLAIETPEQVVDDGTRKKGPDFPYSSIGEMYDALICGIKEVGADQFSWTAENQQERWAAQRYPQIIASLDDAETAVKAIEAQGEGGTLPPNASAPEDFHVEDKYQMDNTAKTGAHGAPYKASPILYKEYAHYGRFLKIKQDGIPPVYAGITNPNHPANVALGNKFTAMVAGLNTLWTRNANSVVTSDRMWQQALEEMRDCVALARQCWEQGIIPDWSFRF